MTTAVHSQDSAATATLAANAVPIRGAGPWRAIRLFAARSVRHDLRDPEALVMAVALPVALMILFTFVFGGALSPGGDYINYVVPGIVLLCSGFGASSTAVTVNRDLSTGTLNRLRTMPIMAATVLGGHVVASLARNLVATVVVVLVGVLLGFRPSADGLEWLGAVGLVAGWILAMTSLFAVIGLVASSPEASTGYGFVLLFLPYVSSAFVPVDTMPSWLQGFAEYQPVTPMIEAIRGLLTGGFDAGTAGVALLWCAGITVVAGVLGALLFRRAGTRA